jgi:hypothetical protein
VYLKKVQGFTIKAQYAYIARQHRYKSGKYMQERNRFISHIESGNLEELLKRRLKSVKVIFECQNVSRFCDTFIITVCVYAVTTLKPPFLIADYQDLIKV